MGLSEQLAAVMQSQQSTLNSIFFFSLLPSVYFKRVGNSLTCRRRAASQWPRLLLGHNDFGRSQTFFRNF